MYASQDKGRLKVAFLNKRHLEMDMKWSLTVPAVQWGWCGHCICLYYFCIVFWLYGRTFNILISLTSKHDSGTSLLILKNLICQSKILFLQKENLSMPSSPLDWITAVLWTFLCSSLVVSPKHCCMSCNRY